MFTQVLFWCFVVVIWGGFPCYVLLLECFVFPLDLLMSAAGFLDFIGGFDLWPGVVRFAWLLVGCAGDVCSRACVGVVRVWIFCELVVVCGCCLWGFAGLLMWLLVVVYSSGICVRIVCTCWGVWCVYACVCVGGGGFVVFVFWYFVVLVAGFCLCWCWRLLCARAYRRV